MDQWNGDLASLQAFANTTVECGDDVCSASENPDTCPSDCPPCGVVDASGGVVDDASACFVGGGPAASLRAVDGTGWDDDLIWTHTTSDTSEANYGQWNLFLAEAGRYRVEVYTAASYAQSTEAAYEVRHGGAVDAVTIDQTAVDGWQSLGEFEFAAGSAGQAVHLGDNTGEPLADNVQLVFDAVRLTRIDPGDGSGSGSGSGDGSGSGSGDGSGDLTGGCAAGGHGAAPVPLALALGALLLRRRRR